MKRRSTAGFHSRYDFGLKLTSVPAVRLYVDRLEEESWFLHVGHVTDRGRWKTEPHAHPLYGQMIFVHTGRGTLNLEGRHYRFEGPCMLLLPPNCVHGLDYEVDVERWVVTIEVAYLKQINSRLHEFIALWAVPRTIALPIRSGEEPEFCRLVKALKREAESSAIGHRVAMEAIYTNLQLLLVRERGLENLIGDTAARSDVRKVERFRHLVDEHFREHWPLKEYALKMGVSLTQLRAACASTPEKSPTKMIHSRIISEAKRHLIFEEATVSEIAFGLGFADAAYFTHFFRREMGQTPTQFRIAAHDQSAHTQWLKI